MKFVGKEGIQLQRQGSAEGIEQYGVHIFSHASVGSPFMTETIIANDIDWRSATARSVRFC
jgi:hypothetical protein